MLTLAINPMTEITIFKELYCISTDKKRLDPQAIHRFLSTEAYWSLDIPLATVEKSIDNSLCFGVYFEDRQIGFARVISDFSTIAYLGDVYIINVYRGKGLSKWLIETVLSHPDLQNLRRWVLLTRDAHGLYQQFGWQEIANPAVWMEIHNKNLYTPNK